MGSQFMLSPTGKAERINSLDITRGIALFGILLMNIVGFGLFNSYADPTNMGGSTGWNLKVWWINTMFFEGTMRGLFSMLFGAGIILFTSRVTDHTQGLSVTDTYFRRILWLLLFGIIHSYLLLWSGEILYPYALIGLIAYSFRNWLPKHLVAGAVILLIMAMALNTYDYTTTKNIAEAASAAEIKKDSGNELSKAEQASIAKWEEIVSDEKPTPEQIADHVAERHKGYLSNVLFRAGKSEYMQTTYMYRHFFWDIFAMMLLGMAFLRNGIFKAARTNRFYLIMAIAGYSIGLTTNYLETDYLMRQQFSILSFLKADITYDVGRVFTTLGHIAVIMLFIKSGLVMFLQKALAAVGQMAFTNYIMHTIICNILFLGFGFALFGQLQRYELYYVVFSIWVLQLILSPIWLSYFRFGPLEWAWRSLTYWQKQPIRKNTN
jgi:uncharacterized protein